MAAFSFRTSQPPSLLRLTLNGERLRLVPTSRDHAEDIFREFTPAITRYMYPRPAERIEETLEFIDRSRERMRAGGNLQFTILSGRDGEFLGCCGLHGEGNERTPELGIWIKRAAHGHGYGREAISVLVAWAFTHLDVDYLVYPVDRRNSGSRKIPESLGGAVTGEKRDEGMAGNQLDLIVYRLHPPENSQSLRSGDAAER
jgi:ribosomal-protein-alanine N-acetyltransferase